MPSLRLESPTDTIDLDEQLQTGKGVQVHSGVLGLGLPPVQVQWVSGAGDGATFRGRRVLPRDIDLPLSLLGANRAELKVLTTRLANALAQECTLRLLDDDGTSWQTKVHRVGGGNYTYGADTDGERELMLVVTLRAGDPYWTSDQSMTQEVGKSTVPRGLITQLVHLRLSGSVASGKLSLSNPGDAPAYPVWTITGPGTNFMAVSQTGETLAWNGTLLEGETLVIDTQLGTVVDGKGDNRYAELGPAPRMWRIPPGASEAVASIGEPTDSSRIAASWKPRRWMVI